MVERRGCPDGTSRCVRNQQRREIRCDRHTQLTAHRSQVGGRNVSRAQLLEELPGWQWDAVSDRWQDTYAQLQTWKARHGNFDPRREISIGGRVRRKSELNAADAEELTLGQWIKTQRGSQSGGKARLSGMHEQVCTKSTAA